MTAAVGTPTEATRSDDRRVVLHVLNVLDRGGLEVRTLEILRGIDPRTVRVIVCTLAGRPGELALKYEDAGAKVVPLRLASPGFPVRFLCLLRAEHVDVVHSHIHFSSGPILTLARIARVPTRIAHFRSDAHGHPRHGLARRTYYAIAKRMILLCATRVVGVSPSSLSANWSPSTDGDPRFQVLPNGIDIEQLQPSASVDVRTELDLGPSTPLVVHVGRADIPTKNRELAVQIVRQARDEGLGMMLAFVGRHGSDQRSIARQERLVETVENLGLGGQVRFLGERDDVGTILHQADAMLSTSTLEGLPGAILEAAACGLRVVSSDVPGATYIADQLDGVEIVRLRAGLEAWTSALRRAVSDVSRESRVRRRTQFASSEFSMLNSLRAYRELWGC